MAMVLPVKMAEMKEKAETFFIELYIIKLRTGFTYIAAADEDIVFNGEKFIAVPFQRQSLEKSLDNITDEVEITLGDVDYGLLTYVMNGFDFRGCDATIIRIQYPDSLSDPNICQLVFTGFLDEPSFSSGTFQCKIKPRMPNIDAPTRSYQLSCNSDFGDAECGMSKAPQEVTVISVDGSELTVDRSFAQNLWQYGVCSLEGEARIISRNDGNKITLNVNFIQPMEGKKVLLERGCDKTKECCQKYANMVHFSGFPAVPFESMYR